MPPSFHRIIVAQFLSALADNALLIVAIALLQRSGQPAWWVPLLRFFFIVAYVVLAPWVGSLADAVPKARLMSWMNGLKWLGAALLAGGLHPLLAFMPASWEARMETILNPTEENSANARLMIWTAIWKLALYRPLLGGGFRRWKSVLDW